MTSSTHKPRTNSHLRQYFVNALVGATLCGRPKIKTNLTKQKITIDKSPKVMYTKNTKKARPQTVVPKSFSL